MDYLIFRSHTTGECIVAILPGDVYPSDVIDSIHDFSMRPGGFTWTWSDNTGPADIDYCLEHIV